MQENSKKITPSRLTMLLAVHVTPKSAKNQIIGWVADAQGQPVLKVKIAAPPEDGKANAELIKFLSKQWDIPKSAIELAGGETSRHKRLRIHSKPYFEQIMHACPL